ncbi:hypothetical protein SAMN04488598_13810 [Halanaerobium congolense]|uniref:Uncharacterized protein n=1 Tax=Halanaerobium congolense TaxID=54121 RepID=A0A1I0CJH7_9FIRM|nr:hypothetical protein [Halanaerobium congolense]PTX14869.1 hypothetical protein C7953_2936 [Halanaerobium congolense]SDG01635.1 hypothetical protein SAMN04488598_13810 [Halanaerobium congolense]SET19766.1 hypothetical protein SAMN04515652_13810 [Halanaerobium congolense]SFP67103.1 hypothetical protein SAMN04488596_13816 [Halanaerobium congolense]
MNILKISKNLNEKSKDYQIGQLQNYRVEINNLTRPGTYDIFSKRSIKFKNNYAYHSGGRKEMQVNIGFEPDREEFRAGFVFSIEPSRSLTEPVEIFEPKIKRFNEFLEKNYDKYSDLIMYYHDAVPKRSDNYPIEQIGDNLIERGMFIFFGKFYDKKAGDNLTDKEYDHVLELLSQMLEIYFYVETGDEKHL